MLGSLILYLKGRRTTMFQLSGFYCKHKRRQGLDPKIHSLGLQVLWVLEVFMVLGL